MLQGSVFADYLLFEYSTLWIPLPVCNIFYATFKLLTMYFATVTDQGSCINAE